MGFLVVPVFYVTAFGFQMGVLPWLLAPVLALAGWFTGDSIRQWNQVRALSQRRA